ncbi:MAG: MFS transporter, partial [Dehalococcoidia bacterium]
MTEAGANASTDGLAPADAARRRRMLAVVALATLGALTVWFSTNAISAALGDEFGFGDGELAWLTIAVQLGFVAGTLLSAFTNLTERVNARRLFAIAAVLAALANVAPIGSDEFVVWLLARFFTGVFLGGVYPPAMHVVSGWYRSGRGLALGVVIGALTLGSGSPHLLRALLEDQWQLTMLVAGALAAIGGIAMWWAVEDGPYHSTPPRVQLSHFWRSVSGRAPLLALGGYLGHMWELYAMWAWLPVFLAEVYEGRELPLVGLAAGSLAAFGVFALGAVSCVVAGAFAERYGRTLVTSVAMIGSGAAAVVIGFTPASLVLVTVLAALWGATVVADSAQFSAAMTELADERYRGS